MTPITDAEFESLFHDFEIVGLKSGTVHKLTQIGATREAAERTLRNFNLKGLDLVNAFHIRNPNEMTEAK